MSDEKKVEVNEEILKEVFKAANITPPSEITDEALLEAVFKLKQSDGMAMMSDGTGDIFNPSSNNILVIDDFS